MQCIHHSRNGGVPFIHVWDRTNISSDNIIAKCPIHLWVELGRGGLRYMNTLYCYSAVAIWHFPAQEIETFCRLCRLPKSIWPCTKEQTFWHSNWSGLRNNDANCPDCYVLQYFKHIRIYNHHFYNWCSSRFTNVLLPIHHFCRCLDPAD